MILGSYLVFLFPSPNPTKCSIPPRADVAAGSSGRRARRDHPPGVALWPPTHPGVPPRGVRVHRHHLLPLSRVELEAAAYDIC
jgi:hypothetical protein